MAKVGPEATRIIAMLRAHPQHHREIVRGYADKVRQVYHDAAGADAILALVEGRPEARSEPLDPKIQRCGYCGARGEHEPAECPKRPCIHCKRIGEHAEEKCPDHPGRRGRRGAA